MSEDNFKKNLRDFLKNLKIACEKSEKSKANNSLKDLTNTVFNKVITDPCINEIVKSYENLPANEQFIKECLSLEMEYFNNRVTADDSYLSSKEGIENGQTVKDSLEDLFGDIPNWIKKALKIINEILSLVKP